jgi:hypothetical protein
MLRGVGSHISIPRKLSSEEHDRRARRMVTFPKLQEVHQRMHRREMRIREKSHHLDQTRQIHISSRPLLSDGQAHIWMKLKVGYIVGNLTLVLHPFSFLPPELLRTQENAGCVFTERKARISKMTGGKCGRT